ncbi:MAG: hypothetical protein DME98_16345 [Verrucomicrobia bacterium]|nr:MAG: hypothetical protein DME98_16345 [Verrucomicrobiota bacterium]PYJ36024.1 MAG: hypothetical protein DME88_00105 [Verrucomicrobiota bacterium]
MFRSCFARSAEIVFDQGLGDLFALRVAGNAIDGHASRSIEDAVDEAVSAVSNSLGHHGIKNGKFACSGRPRTSCLECITCMGCYCYR